ncbi:MAG: hypothetical protein K6D02_07000, partial [Lachnospiraceae bacterium]|nr:hypothetical protein [Lachnospiraceae bacterium]
KLATLPEESITEEEFKSYKTKEEEARNAKDAAVNEVVSLKSKFVANYNNFVKDYKELLKTSIEVLGRITERDNQENIGYLNSVLQEQSNVVTIDESVKQDNVTDVDLHAQIGDLGMLSQILVENMKAISAELDVQNQNKNRYENNEKELKKLRNETLSNIEMEIDKAKSVLESAMLAIKGEESTIETLKRLKYENWTVAFDKQKELTEEADKMEKAIKDSQDKCDDISKKKTELESSVETQNKIASENEKKCEEKSVIYKKKLNEFFKSEEEFKEYISNPEDIDKLNKEIIDYRQKMNAAKELLKESREKVKGKEKVDLEGKKQTENDLRVVFEELREETSTINNRKSNNNKIKEKVADKFKDYEKYDKDNKMHEKLYNLVKGKVKGNSKVTLEQYVQTSGFDSIISAANKRLQPMTDGQFRLLRKENLSGSNDILDLEVYDNFTGRTRPSGNISGGESFKASLSLALGLSDTISQKSGGIQMDALFVDEGFGTLDRKSIDNAIEVLMNLSGKGKLVGIISHREELMEAIENKINVTKNSNGSKFEIIS